MTTNEEKLLAFSKKVLNQLTQGGYDLIKEFIALEEEVKKSPTKKNLSDLIEGDKNLREQPIDDIDSPTQPAKKPKLKPEPKEEPLDSFPENELITESKQGMAEDPLSDLPEIENDLPF